MDLSIVAALRKKHLGSGFLFGALFVLLSLAALALVFARPVATALPGGMAWRTAFRLGLLCFLGGSMGILWTWTLGRRWLGVLPHLEFGGLALLAVALGEWDPLELAVLGATAVLSSLIWWAARSRPWVLGVTLLLGLVAFVPLYSFGADEARALGPADDLRAERPAVQRQAAGPDLLLIVLDTVRRDVLLSYGGTVGTRLDLFAQEAIVFDDAVSTAPWSLPAHASLFTGRYGQHHGASWSHLLVDPDPKGTLAQSLSSLGYQTMAFSANPWLVPGNGSLAGFSTVHLAGQEMTLERAFLPLRVADSLGFGKRDKGARRLLRSFRQSWRGEGPRFAFVNLFEAHAPYARVASEQALPLKDRIASARVDREQTLGSTLPEDLSDSAARSYLFAVEAADRALGEILDWVEEGGRPTGIIVVSDHGEGLGEHGVWGHHDGLWAPILRIPLVVRPPGAGPFSARLSEPVSLVDVPTTLASWAGSTDWWEGRDGVPLGTTGGQRVRLAQHEVSPALIRGLNAHGRHEEAKERAVARVGLWWDGWRYEERSDGQDALFKLEEDPQEERNRVEEAPHRKASMAGRLSRALERSQPAQDPSTPAPGAGMSPAMEERLRALGYIE